MLGTLKGWFGNSSDPIAYRLPLDWFEHELPHDLLATGFHWVWESTRGFKATNASLPESRPLTALTDELAPVLSAEIGEYYLETHREVTIFATATPTELSAPQLQAAIREFTKSGAGPLVAILYQPPQEAAEVFLPRTPQVELAGLLSKWADRLGKPVDQLPRAPGGSLLKRMFLK